MREFILYTSASITIDNCLEELKNEFKEVNVDTEGDICINGKSITSIYLENYRLDEVADYFDTPEQFKEYKEQIPLENPYCNVIETRRSINVKRVAKALKRVFPELFILSNNADEWYGTAQEYIDTEFDY